MTNSFAVSIEKVGQYTARFVITRGGSVADISEYDIGGADANDRSQVIRLVAEVIERCNFDRAPVVIRSDWPVSFHGAYTVQRRLASVIRAFPTVRA